MLGSWVDSKIFPHWWGVEVLFGKDETKQISQLIKENNEAGVVAVCKTVTKGNYYANAVCAYGINFMTENVREGFSQAAGNNSRALFVVSWVGKWKVVEAPDF